jgi:hypothetical protein
MSENSAETGHTNVCPPPELLLSPDIRGEVDGRTRTNAPAKVCAAKLLLRDILL